MALSRRKIRLVLALLVALGGAARLGGVLFGPNRGDKAIFRTLMLTMLLYALGTAACAFAPNIWVLMLCRLAASLGIGGEWAAGAAMVAEGESRFVQIRNLQFKECDRVREPIDELRKVRETLLSAGDEKPRPVEKALYYEPTDDPDTIHVWGAPQGFRGGIDVDGRGDHRVIMLLSIVALRCQLGLRIHGAEHVSKSFPGWFDTLRSMGVRVEES